MECGAVRNDMELRGKRSRQSWGSAESEEEPMSDSQDEVELEVDCSSEDDSRRGRSVISWRGSLEARFLKALQQAGGVWEAKPKAILQRMGAYATQLTTIQVKSHLQKHRIKVAAEMQRQGDAGGGGALAPGGVGGVPLQQARQAMAQQHEARPAAGGGVGGDPKARRRPQKLPAGSQAELDPRKAADLAAARKLQAAHRRRLAATQLVAVARPGSTGAPPTPHKPFALAGLPEQGGALALRHSAPALLLDTASSGGGGQASPASGGSSVSGGSGPAAHHLHPSRSGGALHSHASAPGGHLGMHLHHQAPPHPASLALTAHGGLAAYQAHGGQYHHHPGQEAVQYHHHAGQAVHYHHAGQQAAQYHHHGGQQGVQYLVAQHPPPQAAASHPPHHPPPQHLLGHPLQQAPALAPHPLRHASLHSLPVHPHAYAQPLASQPTAPPALWAAAPPPGAAPADGDGGVAWVERLLAGEPLAPTAPPSGPSPLHAAAAAALGQGGRPAQHPPPCSDSDSDHFHTDFGELLDLPLLRPGMLPAADDAFGGLAGGLEPAAQQPRSLGGGWELDAAQLF